MQTAEETAATKLPYRPRLHAAHAAVPVVDALYLPAAQAVQAAAPRLTLL